MVGLDLDFTRHNAPQRRLLPDAERHDPNVPRRNEQLLATTNALERVLGFAIAAVDPWRDDFLPFVSGDVAHACQS